MNVIGGKIDIFGLILMAFQVDVVQGIKQERVKKREAKKKQEKFQEKVGLNLKSL